ncbi:TlyA family RNA methyltransferase [Larsenimonas salina]|uniref:TlyA family RNA methyltransferase n=1 Tax=Larsenimonas salina TaxID=1295565 RepID=UPI0032ECB913
MGLIRADQLLVVQGLARSRTRAQRLIRNHRVFIEHQGAWVAVTKVSEKLADTTVFYIETDPEERFVSRAGLKLDALLAQSGVSLKGLVVLDVGQSTGGFTDCALHHGAASVIGVEVGHDQLVEPLKSDPRVTCLEGINARTLTQETLSAYAPNGPDAVVMDVSFISQTLILPALAALMRPGTPLLSLVKPQFELSPEAINTKGLVRTHAAYDDVRARVLTCCQTHGLSPELWIDSPITGGDGNREFLLYARRL